MNCVICGKEITGNPKKRYCGMVCKRAAYRERHREQLRIRAKLRRETLDEEIERECECCGKKFKTNILNNIYCSTKCRDFIEKPEKMPKEKPKKRHTFEDTIKAMKAAGFEGHEYGKYQSWRIAHEKNNNGSIVSDDR